MELTQEMNKNKGEILGICLTKHKGTNIQFCTGGYIIWGSGKKERATVGVGIVTKQTRKTKQCSMKN